MLPMLMASGDLSMVVGNILDSSDDAKIRRIHLYGFSPHLYIRGRVIPQIYLSQHHLNARNPGIPQIFTYLCHNLLSHLS